MNSRQLNTIYRAYLNDPAGNESPFFKAVTRAAIDTMQDRDAAQDFVIEVWRSLPIPDPTNFAAWLRRRLYWRACDEWNRTEQNPETPATYLPVAFDEDGERLTNDDRLAHLAHQWSTRTREPEPYDPSEIDNPFIRRVAYLLLEGLTQDEIAERLGMKPSTLRVRLLRFRQKRQQSTQELLAA